MFKYSLLLLMAFAALAFAADEPMECAQSVDIGCIQTYHAAIEQACHKYVPAGDFATVRKHVPNMLSAANGIAEYQLDSTFATVSEDFEAKRQAFLESVNDLKVAADGDDDEALKAAFDNMHSAFGRLAAVLALSPIELTEFHTLVARIWHEYLPAKNYDSIESTIADLRAGCSKLKAAKLHPAKKNIQDEYLAAVENIRASIDKLEKALKSKSDEEIEQAATAFHSSFEEVAALF